MVPVHPGRLLAKELRARDLSANALALALRVPSGRITGMLNEKRGIGAETALAWDAISATAPNSG